MRRVRMVERLLRNQRKSSLDQGEMRWQVQTAALEWTLHTGRQATATDLIAAKLHETRPDDPALVQFVTSMKSIQNKNREDQAWVGNVAHAYQAVRPTREGKSILSEVEETLRKNPEALSTGTLVEKIHRTEKKWIGPLNAALRILERAGKIRLVGREYHGRKNRYQWEYVTVPRETLSDETPRYQLIARIAEGPVRISQLASHPAGSKGNNLAYQVARSLVRDGLAEAKKGMDTKGVRSGTYIQLTPRGRDAWDMLAKEGRISPALQKILLEVFYTRAKKT